MTLTFIKVFSNLATLLTATVELGNLYIFCHFANFGRLLMINFTFNFSTCLIKHFKMHPIFMKVHGLKKSAEVGVLYLFFSKQILTLHPHEH